MSLQIIIVGAGLGRLLASIACALSGHSVTVLESARELAEVGAGLQMTPNASRLLKAWDVLESLTPLAAEPTALTVHCYSDGKVLASDPKFSSHMREKYGAPFIDLHRVDLQRALASRAKDLGVDIRLASAVVSLDFDACSVKIATGETISANLIVGADGLWSKTRQEFLGRRDDPLPTGDLAYRIVLDLQQIEDPELQRWVSEPECHFWIGPSRHAAAYSLRGGKMFNIVLLVPDDLPVEVARQAGNAEEMQKLFDGWDPIFRRFLSYVKKVDSGS